MAKQLTEIETPLLASRPDPALLEEYSKAIEGKRFVYAEVVNGMRFVRFERPGDDGDEPRNAEPCYPGDFIRIELAEKCKYNQSPEYIAFMFSTGQLRAVDPEEYKAQPKWTPVMEARRSIDPSPEYEQNDRIAQLEAEIALLKAMLAKLVVETDNAPSGA